MSDLETPEGWARVPASVLGHWGSGGTPKATAPALYDGGIPWAVIGDLSDGPLRKTERTLSEKGLAESSAKWVPPGALLIAMYGSIGKLGITEIRCTTNQAIAHLVPHSGADVRFLFYQFLHRRADLLAEGKGGAQQNISQGVLKSFEVLLPPVDEQRRIADRLDDLLARARRARETLADVPVLLDQLRQSVLAAAFRGDLTTSWREAHPEVEPAAVLLERIRTERRRRWVAANPKKKYEPPARIDSEAEGLPELPAGWEWATLEDLTDSTRLIQYGILKPGPDIPNGVPYVKVRNMKGEVIDVQGLSRTSPEIHAQYSRSALARGDLLMSIRGSYGGVAIVPDELDGANITQDSARIAPLPGVDRHFLRAMLRSPACQAYFNEVATGMAVRGVNIGDLRPTRVPLPPLAEQVEVAQRVEEAQSAAEAVEAEVAELLNDLQALERATLTKAFRGELCDQDSTDEPVQRLLDRLAHTGDGKPGRPRQGPRSSPRTTQRTEDTTVARDLSKTHLRDTLAAAKGALSPEELLTASGLVDEIDQFYAQLRSEVERGLVRERVVDRRRRVIELIHAD